MKNKLKGNGPEKVAKRAKRIKAAMNLAIGHYCIFWRASMVSLSVYVQSLFYIYIRGIADFLIIDSLTRKFIRYFFKSQIFP